MEYWVEYGFVETPYGYRPTFIRRFKDQQRALAFAEDYDDAHIVFVTAAE